MSLAITILFVALYGTLSGVVFQILVKNGWDPEWPVPYIISLVWPVSLFWILGSYLVTRYIANAKKRAQEEKLIAAALTGSMLVSGSGKPSTF